MRYFSQLDLVKILERAVRRSQLPYYLTKGYTPRVKLSFGNALKVGVEGALSVIFYFKEKVEKELFMEKLLPQLPLDLILLECEYVT